jgi:uncharacterized protein (DUF1684 family)
MVGTASIAPAAAAPEPATAPAPAAATSAPAPAPAAESERRDKETYFRDNPWSPLRAFARFDFTARAPGEPEPSVVVGSAPDSGLRLDGPGILPHHMRLTVLSPEAENGPWRFRIERLVADAAIRIGGEEWPGAPAAPGESASGTPAPAGTRIVDEETVIEAGPFALRPYVQSGAGVVIEFDRRRTEGSAFVPPAWYPVDPAWVFRVPLERHENPETMSVPTTLGRRKEYVRVGYFEVAPPATGPSPPEPVRIHAYRPTFIAQAGESLSILFTDRTTGGETYATGRYLDLGPPQGGLYTLDFNRAYNPLCAYTHVYNCPIPPRENALPIAVRAGEKAWPGRPPH